MGKATKRWDFYINFNLGIIHKLRDKRFYLFFNFPFELKSFHATMKIPSTLFPIMRHVIFELALRTQNSFKNLTQVELLFS